MKFTTKDIKENKDLISFIRHRIKGQFPTKQQGGNTLNIYTTKHVISIIKEKIERHEKGTSSTKHIPRWKAYIKYLQEMENAS